jgi:hypothetical protein
MTAGFEHLRPWYFGMHLENYYFQCSHPTAAKCG